MNGKAVRYKTMNRWRSLSWRSCLFVTAVLTVSVGVGCGFGPSYGKNALKATPVRIGLVVDPGGVNDHSFNASAYAGLKRAEHELGANIEVLTRKSATDAPELLGRLVDAGDDLIIANGSDMAKAVATVAESFPYSNFAITDTPNHEIGGPKVTLKNVKGLVFREEDAGYLVGYLAALYLSEVKGNKVASAIAGTPIPPVLRYVAGYQAGVKAADPAIKVIYGFSHTYVGKAACDRVARQQLARGSKVIFQVAGGCGNAAIEFAKSRGVAAIGVDSDQSYLGPNVITSALKRVDVAIFDIAREVVEGTFYGGDDAILDFQGGEIGIAPLAPSVRRYSPRILAIERELALGTSSVPTTPKPSD